MNEGKAWRRLILICVSALCVTAIACCWLSQPISDRYVPYTLTSASGGAVMDRRTGEIEVVSPTLR